MEDATFVAFCHFISDVFSGISVFSLLLQKNDIILPQVREDEVTGVNLSCICGHLWLCN